MKKSILILSLLVFLPGSMVHALKISWGPWSSLSAEEKKSRTIIAAYEHATGTKIPDYRLSHYMRVFDYDNGLFSELTAHFKRQVPQFGCYKNYCWAYIWVNSYAGEPWCYTQELGVPHGQAKWASCSHNDECSWEMTCGNEVLHYGSD